MNAPKTVAEANEHLTLQVFNCQTKLRGDHSQEFEIFLTFANDGKGGDITRGGAPLPTFEEWLAR
jgi:hypothetical protein